MDLAMPEGYDCPDGCDPNGEKCECEDLSLFDPKGQIVSLFENS